MKNKLMFILARIFGFKKVTLDIDNINGKTTKVTSYLYKGKTYINKTEEIYNIENFCGIDFKGMKFDGITVTETATEAQLKREGLLK